MAQLEQGLGALLILIILLDIFLRVLHARIGTGTTTLRTWPPPCVTAWGRLM